MDEKDLKIQALLERVRDLTVNYENQVADARVKITILDNELQALREMVSVQEDKDAGTVKED